jgi:hypothetical protein
MNGIIDDVRLWNRPLTSEEIVAAMAQRLSGQEEGLVGYWPFDEGEGPIAYDKSPMQNHGRISGAFWTTNAAPVAPLACRLSLYRRVEEMGCGFVLFLVGCPPWGAAGKWV